MYTKEPLPMDIEFMIQDTFALIRPTWKLYANLEESSQAFADAVAQTYKTAETDKPQEVDELDDDPSSDEIGDDEDANAPHLDEDAQSSSDEAEVSHH
jgi:regulator of nonsense transcripts 2